ncbi:MAG: hypothetical protein QOF53_183 [Nocardioidaceae bacterium]|nr:hypothetical protein [Nocardioidaceae bacterium]
MAAKKKSATEKQLKGEVKKLRAKLERADAKARRWKNRARQNEKVTAESQATVKKLRKRLEGESAGRSSSAQPPASASTSTSTSNNGVTPDESWTVVRLRSEAQSRGLTGLSGKSKAQLLELLG